MMLEFDGLRPSSSRLCGRRLLGEARLEILLQRLNVGGKVFRIHEWIRASLGHAGALGRHVVHFWMRRQEHVALDVPHALKGLFVVVDDPRVGRISHEFVQRDRGAAEEDRRVVLVALSDVHGPGRAARCDRVLRER